MDVKLLRSIRLFLNVLGKLGKVKTDMEDAKLLAELYYKDQLKPGPAKRSKELEELRLLSRQHQMINHSYCYC